jgi:hypothetical protein
LYHYTAEADRRAVDAGKRAAGAEERALAAAQAAAEVGLYKLTHSLKAPGFK